MNTQETKIKTLAGETQLRAYCELTEIEQAHARSRILNSLLYDMATGEYQPPRHLRKRIKAAINRAKKQQALWLCEEYMRNNCRAELEEIALRQAKNALYVAKHEIMVFPQ